MELLYLITKFNEQDLKKEEFAKQASSLNEKIQEEGCQLLTHSDQWDVFVYRLEEKHEKKIRDLGKVFTEYSRAIFQADFLFDLFTQEEIEDPNLFSTEFIQAIKMAEGQGNG